MMKNPPHPGRIVRDELLEPFGLTVGQAAEALGIIAHLSNLLNEKAGITPEMAIRLSKALGMTRISGFAFNGNGLALAMKDAEDPRGKLSITWKRARSPALA